MVQVLRPYMPGIVVEVGSGGLGIGPYLKQPFIGLDLSFDPPVTPYLIPVKASGVKLPLKTQSADVVINSDMLEHLPASLRQAAVIELFRVTKKCLIIGVPTGQAAYELDCELDQEYRAIHQAPHPFLVEHVANGLPEMGELKHLLQTAAVTLHRQVTITYMPNQNLSLRRFLLKGWVSQNLLVNIFFRKILLLGIPLMRFMNQPPVYRTICVISFV